MAVDKIADGYALQIWSKPNAQGYEWRQHGESRRMLTEHDGLALVYIPRDRPWMNSAPEPDANQTPNSE